MALERAHLRWGSLHLESFASFFGEAGASIKKSENVPFDW